MTIAQEGNRVTIRYTCRLEDGTIYDVADRDLVTFIVGEGNTLPEFENAVQAMAVGDVATIRVPMREAEQFVFQEEGAPNEGGFPAGTTPGVDEGYDLMPGEEADHSADISPETFIIERPGHPDPDDSEDLIFDIELVSVEPGEVELNE